MDRDGVGREGLRETLRNVSQNNWSVGQDLNFWPPRYVVGVLTTWLWHLVFSYSVQCVASSHTFSSVSEFVSLVNLCHIVCILHLQVFMHVLLEGSMFYVWCRVSWEWQFFLLLWHRELVKISTKTYCINGCKSIMFCGHFLNSFFSVSVHYFILFKPNWYVSDI